MGRNTVSGILSVASAKVITLLIGLVTSPLLYRMLGEARFGQYATVMSVHALFMIFVNSGVTRGVRKYVAEDRYVGDWEDQVVGFYFRLAVLLAGAGAIVYLLAARSGFVGWIWGPEFTTYFTLAIGMVVVTQFRSFARSALMGFGLERYSEPLTVIYWVGFATVGLTLIAMGYGVVGALLGQMVGSTIAAVLGMLVLWRRVDFDAFVRRPSSMLPRRRMMTYNTNTIALTFLLLSLYHVDVIMLQTLTDSATTGNYKAALKLAEFLWFVPMTIQTVFVHSTSELWSQDHTDRIASMASKATRYTLLLTAVMTIGLAALAPVIVPLYWGPGATAVVTPLLLLLPGALGFAAVRPTLAIEEGHGTLRYSIVATGTAAVINLGLNLLLIPRYGMAGAAVATSVGYGSMFLFHLWSARMLGFNPLGDARLLRIAVTAAIAAVPIFAAGRLITAEVFSVVVIPAAGLTAAQLLAIFVVPPLGLAVFLAAAFATRALEVDECLELLASFPEPIAGYARRLRAGDGPSIHVGTIVPSGGQRWLLVVGIALMVAGTGLAIGNFGIGPGGGGAPAVNGTATPTDDGTDPATTPDGGPNDDDPATPAGTDGPTPTDAPPGTTPANGTTTPNGTSTPTDTPDDPFDDDTPDDPIDDGTPDDPFDDDTPEDPTDDDTPEDTDTPTDTETPTEAPTDSPTEPPTNTDTPTPSQTPTESPTDTETATTAPPSTETPGETDDATETTDDGATNTDTADDGTTDDGFLNTGSTDGGSTITESTNVGTTN